MDLRVFRDRAQICGLPEWLKLNSMKLYVATGTTYADDNVRGLT